MAVASMAVPVSESAPHSRLSASVPSVQEAAGPAKAAGARIKVPAAMPASSFIERVLSEFVVIIMSPVN
jgi:hypothetical protein